MQWIALTTNQDINYLKDEWRDEEERKRVRYVVKNEEDKRGMSKQ